MDCVAYKNLYIEIWQTCLLKNNYIYIQFAGGKMHSEEISHEHCLGLEKVRSKHQQAVFVLQRESSEPVAKLPPGSSHHFRKVGLFAFASHG